MMPFLRTLTAFAWATCLLLPAAMAQTQAGPSAAEPAQGSGAMAQARRLVETTAARDHAELLQPFTDERRSDWHYTPRSRDGIAWKAMSQAQRDAATALMRTALSDKGHEKVRALMALEITLRELESFGFSRDPDNYAFAIYGQPGAPGWGWRIEGHHLSLHFSLQGDRYVGTLPQFFGANPATVPRQVAAHAPRSGFRLLGTEEDLARRLLASLNSTQRQVAIFDTRTYGDIVTRNARQAQALDTVGLEHGRMNEAQQAMLMALIETFAEHLQPRLAQARMARVRAEPVASIRFGWAGGDVSGKPFYFRIQGATFLIEFDNSGGNHVHSVWRDFNGDFGRDVLAEHYRKAVRAHHPPSSADRTRVAAKSGHDQMRWSANGRHAQEY